MMMTYDHSFIFHWFPSNRGYHSNDSDILLFSKSADFLEIKFSQKLCILFLIFWSIVVWPPEDEILQQSLRWFLSKTMNFLVKSFCISYNNVLQLRPAGVAILLVASCYRNRDKLRQPWATRFVKSFDLVQWNPPITRTKSRFPWIRFTVILPPIFRTPDFSNQFVFLGGSRNRYSIVLVPVTVRGFKQKLVVQWSHLWCDITADKMLHQSLVMMY